MGINTQIEVTDLHKSFGKNEVLKGITTKFEKGDVVCIIGPSGSGKSTFLRALNGLETGRLRQPYHPAARTAPSSGKNALRPVQGCVMAQMGAKWRSGGQRSLPAG